MKIFQDSHIVIGYLPRGKIQGFFKSGHIVMGYLSSGKIQGFFRMVIF
jgi:GTP cyclohydrolase I